MRLPEALSDQKKLGRYRCGEKECRKDFTVMTKTVMERSHAKLTQWAAAFHLAATSKKGFSAHQLHRELGCQYNTAWFLHHRVMEAMRRGGLEPHSAAVAASSKPTRRISASRETHSRRRPRKGRRTFTRAVVPLASGPLLRS